MSSTSPVSSSKVTRSPIRIGCVIASRIPAIAVGERLAGGEADHEAEHRRRGEDAGGDARCASGNLAAAIATPIRTITTKTSRRTSRRRVWVAGESSPRVTTSPTLRAASRDDAVDDLARPRTRPRRPHRRRSSRLVVDCRCVEIGVRHGV